MQNYFTNIIVIVICFVCLKFNMILNNMINIDATGLYSAANSSHKIIGRFIIIIILNRRPIADPLTNSSYRWFVKIRLKASISSHDLIPVAKQSHAWDSHTANAR